MKHIAANMEAINIAHLQNETPKEIVSNPAIYKILSHPNMVKAVATNDLHDASQPLPSGPDEPYSSIFIELEVSALNEPEYSALNQSIPSGLNKPRVMTQAEIATNYSPKKTIRDFYHENRYSLDLQEKEVTKPLKDNPEQPRAESSHDYPE